MKVKLLKKLRKQAWDQYRVTKCYSQYTLFVRIDKEWQEIISSTNRKLVNEKLYERVNWKFEQLARVYLYEHPNRIKKPAYLWRTKTWKPRNYTNDQ